MPWFTTFRTRITALSPSKKARTKNTNRVALKPPLGTSLSPTIPIESSTNNYRPPSPASSPPQPHTPITASPPPTNTNAPTNDRAPASHAAATPAAHTHTHGHHSRDGKGNDIRGALLHESRCTGYGDIVFGSGECRVGIRGRR